jgi:hypothetical protein
MMCILAIGEVTKTKLRQVGPFPARRPLASRKSDSSANKRSESLQKAEFEFIQEHVTLTLIWDGIKALSRGEMRLDLEKR